MSNGGAASGSVRRAADDSGVPREGSLPALCAACGGRASAKLRLVGGRAFLVAELKRLGVSASRAEALAPNRDQGRIGVFLCKSCARRAGVRSGEVVSEGAAA